MDILQLLGSYCFPIVVCLGMGWYVKYITDKNMQNASPLNVGDIVNTNTIVGIMGATGNVTGIHLHLEYATSPIWNYNTFLNPSDALGIPNERGTIVHFDGSIPPPIPTFIRKRKNFLGLYLQK